MEPEVHENHEILAENQQNHLSAEERHPKVVQKLKKKSLFIFQKHESSTTKHRLAIVKICF